MKQKLIHVSLLLLTIIGLSASKINSEEYSLLAKPETIEILIHVCNPNGTAIHGTDVYANGVLIGTSSEQIISLLVAKGTEVTITAYKDGYQMINHSFSKTHFTEEETSIAEPNDDIIYTYYLEAFVILAPIR